MVLCIRKSGISIASIFSVLNKGDEKRGQYTPVFSLLDEAEDSDLTNRDLDSLVEVANVDFSPMGCKREFIAVV